MGSLIKKTGTKFFHLTTKALLLALLALLLLTGSFLLCVSGVEASSSQKLSDLEIGDRVVDPSWEWEHRTGADYTYQLGDVTKPVTWIVVAKGHYASETVTLLSEELIGKHAFDNSTDRGSIHGSNHWGDSGTTNATCGLRPWLNSIGIHEGEGFYHAFSENFKNIIVTITVPNKEWEHGDPYTTEDKVFIPSTTELGDTAHSSTYLIGSVYEYFDGASNADRIAQLGGTDRWYWTRSPDSNGGAYVRNVHTTGAFSLDLAYNVSVGVRPALNLQSEILVSAIPNDDGAYEILHPFFSVYPQFHWISGENWPADTGIEVKIYDNGDELYDDTTTSDDQGYFYFDLWGEGDEPDHELEPGQRVVITAGSGDDEFSKEHVVKDVGIYEVDLVENKVHGWADSPGSEVKVEIWGDNYRYLEVSPHDENNWLADFSANGFDFTVDGSISASETDEDGDSTYQYWGPPFFLVNPESNDIWGHGWEPGQIEVSIDGLTDSIQTEANEDGDFELWVSEFDIIAGTVIEVSGGGVTKRHTVTQLANVTVDPATDTVSGTAEPGSEVFVDIYDGPFREVTADGSGDWTAVFEEGDIDPDSEGNANQSDNQRDATHIYWRVPNPFFIVARDDNAVWGHEWPCNVDLTITVNSDEYQAKTGEGAEWVSCNDFFYADETLVFKVGDEVTVSDGDTELTHVVTNIQVTEVDVDNSTVKGTAEANSLVEVEIHGFEPDELHPRRLVTADPLTGQWVANFSESQYEYECPSHHETYEFGPDTSGMADELDSDVNARTRISWHVTNPHININPRHYWISGHEWPANIPVTLSIGGMLYEPDGGINTNEDGHFNVDVDSDTHDLVVGTVVEVSDGTTTRSHTIMDLNINMVNYVEDTVAGNVGLAEELAVVQVVVVNQEIEGHPPIRAIKRDDLVAGGGLWVADFSEAVPEGEPWEGIYDLELGDIIVALARDNQRNATVYVDPQRFIQVGRDGNWINGNDWLPSVDVEIEVSGASGDYSSGPANVDEWGHFHHVIDREDIEIAEGYEVTVNQAGFSRTHIVTGIMITEVDSVNSTISGTATPGSWVEVQVNREDHGEPWHEWPRRAVQAEGEGNWQVDFSEPGSPPEGRHHEPGYGGIHNLTYGDYGDALEFDQWWSATIVHWNVPTFYILSLSANPAIGGTANDLTGIGPYEAGAIINIKAEPNPGYAFSHWSSPAGTFDNANAAETTFTMPDQDVNVTANFTPELVKTKAFGFYDHSAGQVYVKYDHTPGSADATYRLGPRGNNWQVRVGDFNGDGRETFGFYDHAAGRVYVKYDHNPGSADATYRLGPRGNNWKVLVGDFNGDGKDTFGFYDHAAGRVYVKYDHSAGAADATYRLGPRGNNWEVLVGDFNGDSKETFGFYDRTDGRVYVKYDHSAGAADATYRLGSRGNNWKVFAGDFNGDGKDTFGFYDHAGGQVYAKYDHTPGAADATYRLGPRENNWEVRVGDYNGNGVDTFGFYDRAAGRVYVKYDHSAGAADATYRLGPRGNNWEVLVGSWR